MPRQIPRPQLRGLVRRDEGVALVEFVLVLPVLLLLLFGMTDFGRAFNYWIDGTHLANEGARWAVVNKNPGSGITLQQYIQRQATTDELKNGGSSTVPTPLQVCISFPNGTSNVGDPVKVTASVDFHWMSFVAGKIGILNQTIAGSSTMRLEARPTNYSAGCS